MFTLTQVQYFFDYAMFGFYQYADKSRPDAVKRAAQVAAAATTMVNKEAKMAAKTKDAVMKAGLEAVVFNKNLTGQAHRQAFDIQFAISMKRGLEDLFNIENIAEYDLTRDKAPVLPIVEEVKTSISTCSEVHEKREVSSTSDQESNKPLIPFQFFKAPFAQPQQVDACTNIPGCL